jgi:hypothetical protein
VSDPEFPAEVWRGRYAAVSSTITRLAREVQTVEIADRVQTGELTYAQGERVSMFLDLERLGLAQRYYPKSVYTARKREARKLGYVACENGAEPLIVKLAELRTQMPWKPAAQRSRGFSRDRCQPAPEAPRLSSIAQSLRSE